MPKKIKEKKEQENKQTFAFCFQYCRTEPNPKKLNWAELAEPKNQRVGVPENWRTEELEHGSPTKYLTGKLGQIARLVISIKSKHLHGVLTEREREGETERVNHLS